MVMCRAYTVISYCHSVGKTADVRDYINLKTAFDILNVTLKGVDMNVCDDTIVDHIFCQGEYDDDGRMPI